jgi:hypothetical protein
MYLLGLMVLAGACTDGSARGTGSTTSASAASPANAASSTSAHAQTGGSTAAESIAFESIATESRATESSATESRAAGPADSILPMATMIARFQAGRRAVTSLGPAAARSRAELVGRVVAAVADSNTAALNALTMNAAEFGYLYFPTSIYAREPYAQPPEVTWLLLDQNSRKGLLRLLREYGGKPLRAEGHRCTGEPGVEGMNRIHEYCTVQIRNEDGSVQDVRLFGSIIEREGRFKLMSVSNRL